MNSLLFTAGVAEERGGRRIRPQMGARISQIKETGVDRMNKMDWSRIDPVRPVKNG